MGRRSGRVDSQCCVPMLLEALGDWGDVTAEAHGCDIVVMEFVYIIS
jgi:hypothetical protein